MPHNEVTLDQERTVVIHPSKTIVATVLKVESASMNFSMGTANVMFVGQDKPTRLYPDENKPSEVTDAEAIIATQVGIIVKSAIESGEYN